MEKLAILFKKHYKSIITILVAVLFVAVYICWPKNETSTQKKEQVPIQTLTEEKKQEIKKEKYYGFLFLGSDKGAGKTNGGNHTDSIMYVAYSPEKNKAYIMPIYRDTMLSLTCGGEKNINHVYRDNGPECLMSSISKLLTLPVDYYLYTTADAFVAITDSIGGVPIVAEETFCSVYSNDEKTYCVEKGKSYQMSGNMLLAYARDRNHGSGVPRANRHQAIISSLMKSCMNKFGVCIKEAAVQMLKGNIAHNIPVSSLSDLKDSVFQPNEKVEMVSMGSIQGENYVDGENVWHMRVNPADIANKKSIIENEFGERK